MKNSAKGKQIAITLPPDLDAAVADWIASQPVPPSKSAALAHLVRIGLQSVVGV